MGRTDPLPGPAKGLLLLPARWWEWRAAVVGEVPAAAAAAAAATDTHTKQRKGVMGQRRM